jgi:hypothetical protein
MSYDALYDASYDSRMASYDAILLRRTTVRQQLCITTRSELGAVNPKGSMVRWYCSGPPQGWFKPRLRPKDFVVMWLSLFNLWRFHRTFTLILRSYDACGAVVLLLAFSTIKCASLCRPSKTWQMPHIRGDITSLIPSLINFHKAIPHNKNFLTKSIVQQSCPS